MLLLYFSKVVLKLGKCVGDRICKGHSVIRMSEFVLKGHLEVTLALGVLITETRDEFRLAQF
jgi:hypothetical protein